MPSYQMDGSKIEQNVVQVSATSSIVETVAQTPASSSQCPISPDSGDDGYVDSYRGWSDASGCGICQDYCRWVGNSGSGGDPSLKTTYEYSYWSCRKAGGSGSYPGTNTKDICPDSSINYRTTGGCELTDIPPVALLWEVSSHTQCSGQGISHVVKQ